MQMASGYNLFHSLGNHEGVDPSREKDRICNGLLSTNQFLPTNRFGRHALGTQGLIEFVSPFPNSC